MMKYLLIVDLQKEFAKDRQGKKVYEKCLNYIEEHGVEYDMILAAVYRNEPQSNIERFLGWTDVQKPKELDFRADNVFYHSGYAIQNYPYVRRYDSIDIFGFDTDACVMCMAFDIFNLGCSVKILTEYCWSSGGKKFHDMAVQIMKRQFGSCVV